MADMTQDNFPEQLKQVIEEGLRSVGVEGTVDVEPIPQTRMCRVYVVSSKRDALSPAEWHKLTTEIVRDRLGREAALRVGMIYTVTPDELASYREAQ